MGQGGRLARAGAGHDQQGFVPVRGRRALLFVQLLEHGPDRGDRSRFGITSQCILPDSSFTSAGSGPTARWAARLRVRRVLPKDTGRFGRTTGGGAETAPVAPAPERVEALRAAGPKLSEPRSSPGK